MNRFVRMKIFLFVFALILTIVAAILVHKGFSAYKSNKNESKYVGGNSSKIIKPSPRNTSIQETSSTNIKKILSELKLLSVYYYIYDKDNKNFYCEKCKQQNGHSFSCKNCQRSKTKIAESLKGILKNLCETEYIDHNCLLKKGYSEYELLYEQYNEGNNNFYQHKEKLEKFIKDKYKDNKKVKAKKIKIGDKNIVILSVVGFNTQEDLQKFREGYINYIKKNYGEFYSSSAGIDNVLKFYIHQLSDKIYNFEIGKL